MGVRSYFNGHPICWRNESWVYEDGEPIDKPRPCPQCGGLPTKGGHDSCLGHIPGAQAACCGHGVDKGYVMMTKCRHSQCGKAHTKILQNSPGRRGAIAGSGHSIQGERTW